MQERNDQLIQQMMKSLQEAALQIDKLKREVSYLDTKIRMYADNMSRREDKDSPHQQSDQKIMTEEIQKKAELTQSLCKLELKQQKEQHGLDSYLEQTKGYEPPTYRSP